MALEILVSLLCLGGYECSLASKAYYQGSPVAHFYASNLKQAADRNVKKPILVAVPALITLQARHTMSLRMSRNLTIVGNPDTLRFMYGFTF